MIRRPAVHAPQPLQHELMLRDGRRLGYAEVGDPRGRPVLYLHGAIGSPMRPCDALTGVVGALGIRYLLVSRPGFGASDAQPGRTLLDHARDVGQLLDSLDLARADVVGVSAGGPYALACAHALPDRVGAVAAVSSLTPDVGGGTAGVQATLALVRRRPDACARVGDAVLRAAPRRPRLMSGASGGLRAVVEDYVLGCRPWGFEPGAIEGPAVQLWHGQRDGIVPARHALALARAMPRARVVLEPEAGHFFLRRRLREILGALLAAGELRGAGDRHVGRDVAAVAAAHELQGAPAATHLEDAAPGLGVHDDLRRRVAPAQQDDRPGLLDGELGLHTSVIGTAR